MSTTADVTIDHTYFPLIINLIFAHATYESLLSLRTASKQFRDRVDRHFLLHVVVDGQLDLLGVASREDYAIRMGDGRRIPRADWRHTDLAQHVKRLDVRYLHYDQADLIDTIGPVNILRDMSSGLWMRPSADVHIICDPTERICNLAGRSPTRTILLLDQGRGHRTWNPFPSFLPTEFTVVLHATPLNESQDMDWSTMYHDAKYIACTVARLLKRRLDTAPGRSPKNVPVTLCNLGVWSSRLHSPPLCSEKGIKDEIRSYFADLASTDAGSELTDALIESITFMSLSALRGKVGDEVFSCIFDGIPPV